MSRIPRAVPSSRWSFGSKSSSVLSPCVSVTLLSSSDFPTGTESRIMFGTFEASVCRSF